MFPCWENSYNADNTIQVAIQDYKRIGTFIIAYLALGRMDKGKMARSKLNFTCLIPKGVRTNA